MPDKQMPKEEFDRLIDRIENLMMDLSVAQSLYRGQTGVNYMPPLRLAPRKRREAAESSIRERIGRIQNEIEAIDEQAGDAPDAFTDCLACAVRDFEEMLLQLEEAEERRLDPPTHLPRNIVPVIGLRPYLEVGE